MNRYHTVTKEHYKFVEEIVPQTSFTLGLIMVKKGVIYHMTNGSLLFKCVPAGKPAH